MSVYRPKGSPFYHFDFQLQRRRFHGSTGQRDRRKAEAVERAERENAKELLKASAAAGEGLTLDLAFDRYWQEVGQHHAQSATTFRDLERLTAFSATRAACQKSAMTTWPGLSPGGEGTA